MNDFEKILTGGGMVFKKKGKDENAGEKKIKFSDFLRGTHKSGAAKMRAEVNYQLFRTFACELMWIDLYCLQPQEKMLKTSPF